MRDLGDLRRVLGRGDRGHGRDPAPDDDLLPAGAARRRALPAGAHDAFRRAPVGDVVHRPASGTWSWPARVRAVFSAVGAAVDARFLDDRRGDGRARRCSGRTTRSTSRPARSARSSAASTRSWSTPTATRRTPARDAAAAARDGGLRAPHARRRPALGASVSLGAAAARATGAEPLRRSEVVVSSPRTRAPCAR